MKIKDSIILITGAATRVGREVALFFAEKGAHISFSYYLEDEPWQETKQAIEAFGVKCKATKVEIRQKSQIEELVTDTVQRIWKDRYFVQQCFCVA